MFELMKDNYEKRINELVAYRKEIKKEIEQVATEYSFRRKINALLKKHSYLDVLWDGDDDVEDDVSGVVVCP